MFNLVLKYKYILESNNFLGINNDKIIKFLKECLNVE